MKIRQWFRCSCVITFKMWFVGQYFAEFLSLVLGLYINNHICTNMGSCYTCHFVDLFSMYLANSFMSVSIILL